MNNVMKGFNVRRLLVCVFSLLLTGVGSAGDAGVTLSDAIDKCWTRPVSAEVTPFSVTMLIRIDNNGMVQDITAKSYPKSPEGKLIVQSLSRAIQRCEPYKDIASGEVEVTLSDNMKRKNLINPLK